MRFAYTGPTTIRIGGIYQANALIGSYLVSVTRTSSPTSGAAPGAVLVRTTAAPASTAP